MIGIGSGHPDHLTGEAWAALRSVAYVVAVSKGDGDPLLGVRRALCDQAGVPLVVVQDPERDRDPSDYLGAVRDWHEARVAVLAEVLATRPGDVGLLVWGDPSLYDSTLRIVDRLEVPYDVLPGLSAPQLLAAAHRIVLHPVGRPVLVTPGRRLLAEIEAGHDNLVVMLDGKLACLGLAEPESWEIWWGANLGTTSERLMHGRLDEVSETLRSARAEASGDAGWVMDTYLLRRIGGRVPSTS